MAIKIPSVKAPSLITQGQSINVPRGAFGEDVATAITNLGSTTEGSANKLNLAFARNEERRSSTRANAAFKTVPISQYEALDAAKQRAVSDPRLLPTLMDDEIKRYDDEMSAITKDMDKRTKLKFDALSLPLRTAIGKNLITYSRAQEVVNGRNEMNSVVDALVATASQVADTEDLKIQTAARLALGQKDGHLLDGKLRPQDLFTRINAANRQIDVNKAHSLVDKSPQLLREMLDDPDQLKDLTDADETLFRNRADSSLGNIKEKAEHAAWASNIDLFGQQGINAFLGIANYNELAPMVDQVEALLVDDPDSPILRMQRKVLNDLITMANSPQDVREKAKAKAIIEGRRATQIADQDPDVGKAPKVSEEDQLINQRVFIGRYNQFIDTKTRRRGASRRGPTTTTIVKDASIQLQELANIQGDMIRAVAEGKIKRGFALEYFEKLMDPMRNLIESKHFQPQSGFWGNKIKGADKYSGAFTHVLEELEKAASGGAEFMNSPTAQNLAITFVFEEAERQNLNPDPSKNKSEDAQKLMTSISRVALDRTKRILLSLDSQDEIPGGVMRFVENQPKPKVRIAPQEAIDRVLANPDSAVHKKFFIQNYSQDQFDAIFKEE